MKISTFFYNLKQGLKNINRNKMFSLASVATMAACIFLFGLVFSIVVNFRYMVKQAEQGVAVTVFFQEGTTETKIKELQKEIETREEVAEVNFMSGDDAWENFAGDYFGEEKDLAEGFEQDNPLKESDSLEVYLKDTSRQAELVEYIEALEEVRRVNKSDIVADTFSNFNILIGYISIAIILILLAVSVFLISNTVTIGIAVRREEIAIMKLIGAKDFFVKAPFIVEGIILGMIGSAIPLIGLFYLYNKVLVYVQDRFNILTDILVFLPAGDVFRVLLPAGIGLGIGIGFVGSFFTIRKHLKV